MDGIILAFDRALRTLAGVSASLRPVPGSDLDDAVPAHERPHVAALMRVNHSGEVCAQALYQGQALFARDASVAAALQASADEEVEHLAWTASRIAELGGRVSALTPFWYAGAFAIGAGAGVLGDRWSLGFLRETECQVVAHLSGHLARIPESDARSRAIIVQMRDDEGRHAELAAGLGAAVLPGPVRHVMQLTSRAMTTVAYYV